MACHHQFDSSDTSYLVEKQLFRYCRYTQSMLVYEAAAADSYSSSRVLDVGTKDGRHLVDVHGEVVALDVELSPSIEGPSFLLADGGEMPFADDSFDIVVSNQVYEHVSKDVRGRMTEEISRVLRPDGEFLISAPNRFFPLGGCPHRMPRYWTFLPKSVGIELARPFVDEESLEYYEDELFPFAAWSLRSHLEERFQEVEYITLELGERFGDDVWPDWFNSVFPYIQRLTSYPGFRTAFEWSFGYIAYRCQVPKQGDCHTS